MTKDPLRPVCSTGTRNPMGTGPTEATNADLKYTGMVVRLSLVNMVESSYRAKTLTPSQIPPEF